MSGDRRLERRVCVVAGAGGDVERVVPMDAMPTEISVHWFTQCIDAVFYREDLATDVRAFSRPMR